MKAIVSFSWNVVLVAILALKPLIVLAQVPIPDDVYKPEISGETSGEERLRAPWSPDNRNADPSPVLPGQYGTTSTIDPERYVNEGNIEAKDLTSGGDIPAGQDIKTVNYLRCQFSEGYSLVLLETGGCEVREFYWSCDSVKELWWVRRPPLLMSISTLPGPQGYKRILICPNGRWQVLPGIRESGKQDNDYSEAPPVNTPGYPPVWSPPMQQPATAPVNASAGSVKGPEPDTIDTTLFYWRTVLPAKIEQCIATYSQILYKRLTRLNVRTGVETVISDVPEANVPPRSQTERVPNCGG